MTTERRLAFYHLAFALLAGAAVVAVEVLESRVDHPHERLQALVLAGSWAGAAFVTSLSLFTSGMALVSALRRHRAARRAAWLTSLAVLPSAGSLIACLA